MSPFKSKGPETFTGEIEKYNYGQQDETATRENGSSHQEETHMANHPKKFPQKQRSHQFKKMMAGFMLE